MVKKRWVGASKGRTGAETRKKGGNQQPIKGTTRIEGKKEKKKEKCPGRKERGKQCGSNSEKGGVGKNMKRNTRSNEKARRRPGV